MISITLADILYISVSGIKSCFIDTVFCYNYSEVIFKIVLLRME